MRCRRCGRSCGSPLPPTQDLRECTLEFPAGTSVDERIETAVAVAEPEAEREQWLRNLARRTQCLCKEQVKKKTVH